MKIEYSYGTQIKNFGECVMAIGFFDGVHIAHRELILTAKAEAERLSLPVGVFTFKDNAQIKRRCDRIYGDEEKESILSSLGVDFTVLADFSSLKNLERDDFINEVLIRDFGCRLAVVGYNFKFGKGALGDAEYLKNKLVKLGRDCVIKSEVRSLGRTVSSSYIKELISSGSISEANRLLGIPYSISSIVEHGDGRGRTLGFPTLNSALSSENLILKRGVYRSAIDIDGRLIFAVTNVGTCPTFSERATHLESFLIDFDEDLYGKSVRIYFLDFLREERKFSDAESLKKQIKVDINTSIKKNEEEKWQALGLK